ncbi:hypothetical protein ES708_17834 [subsurface metagenome]
MHKRRYLWFILILIIALSLSFYFIYYKGKDKSTVQTEEEIEEVEEYIEVKEAPVKIEKGAVVGFKDGRKGWEIEADKISLGEDRKRTIFEEIKRAIIFKYDKPYLKIKLEKCITDM